MINARHNIQRVNIDLQIKHEKRAQHIQNEASAFARNELPGIIESIFNKVDTSKRIHVIDKIEIDLGNIQFGHFKADFISRFKTQFAKEFRSKHKEETKKQEVLKTKTNASDSSEVLKHYLQFGTLPWYLENETVDLNVELRRVLKSNDLEFIQFLETKLQESSIRDRIVYSFSEKNIHLLTAALLGTKMSELDRFLKQSPLIIPTLVIKSKHVTRAHISEGLLAILLQIASMHKSSALTIKEIFVSKIGNTFFSSTEEFAKEMLDVIKSTSPSQQKQGHKKSNPKTDFLDTLKEWSHILKHVQSSTNDRPTDMQQTTKREAMASSSLQSDAQENQETLTTDYYISNGGLALLHPFLARLFMTLNLLKEGAFINKAAQHKAMHLLQYAVFGNKSRTEYQMVLNKVLCAYPLNEPIPFSLKLSRKEKQEVTNMIKATISHWDALKNTSVEGFQQSFLQRNAVLKQTEKNWELSFERVAFDVLLDRIPWNYNFIKLPWMQKHLTVKW